MSEPRPAIPTLLHLDDDVCALNKPAGMLCGAGNAEIGGALDHARAVAKLPDDAVLLTTHKYDAGASGIVLLARSDGVRATLEQQFRDGAAEIIWQALVTGYVDEDGSVDTPLYFDKRAARLQTSQRRGEPACTTYRIVQRVAGATLLECRATPGRDEQVRVHLSSIGYPLCVDPRHGGAFEVRLSTYKPRYRPSARREERPLIARLSLHASLVRFQHPRTGETLEVQAPLHKDFRATLTQLSRL